MTRDALGRGLSRRLSCPRTQELGEVSGWPSGLSSKQTQQEHAGCQVPRPRHPPPRLTALTCPSLGRKGRLATGGGDPWSRGRQGSPLFSSLLLLCSPPRPPDAPRHTHPSRRASSRGTRLATFRLGAGQQGRRSASTSGRWPGQAGQVAASRRGGGQSGRRAVGASSLAPNPFCPQTWAQLVGC